MLQVFYPNPVEDEDVNQIHLHKIIGEMAQDIIHHPNEPFVRKFIKPKGITNHSKIP
jgi:hypothetical protein